MYRSHLKLSACILAITALMLAPAGLHAQPARSIPSVATGSPWSGLGEWLDDLVARFAPASPAATIRTQAAPAQAGGPTGPSPGDWQCLECTEAGNLIDPDG